MQRGRCNPSAVHTLPTPFSISSALSIETLANRLYTPFIYIKRIFSLSSLFFFFLSFRQILFSVIETRKFSIALLATDCLLCNETLVIYQSDFIFRSSDLTSAFYSEIHRCTVGKSFIILSLYFSSLPKLSISFLEIIEIERFKFPLKKIFQDRKIRFDYRG